MTDPMRQIDRSLIQEMEEASRAAGWTKPSGNHNIQQNFLGMALLAKPLYRVSRKTTRKQANPHKSRIPEWSNHWVLIVYYQATLAMFLPTKNWRPSNMFPPWCRHVFKFLLFCFFVEGLYKIPPRLVNDDCFWRDWCGAPDVVCLSLCRFQIELQWSDLFLTRESI